MYDAVLGDEVVGVVVDASQVVGRPGRVTLTGVVVDHVEPHLDPGRVHRGDHVAELGHRVVDGVGVVRGEEVHGHVPPVVALLRVELLNRQQFQNGDPELGEVGDLLDQCAEGAPAGGRHPAVLTSGEPLDVGLVDHRVMGVSWPRLKRRLLARCRVGQLAEHGHPVVRPLTAGGLTREVRREVQPLRVGVAQHLGRHETVAAAGGAIDLVGVVRRSRHLHRADHAVPDPAGLVHQRVVRELQDRGAHVIGAVDQERHAGGGSRVQREVPRLLRLHPGRPERGRRALLALPCLDRAQAPHSLGHRGLLSFSKAPLGHGMIQVIVGASSWEIVLGWRDPFRMKISWSR